MQVLKFIGIIYFVLLFVLVNWKGRAFLELSPVRRTVLALIAGGLWGFWIVALHLAS